MEKQPIAKKDDAGMVEQAMEWAYEKALQGGGPVAGAAELANLHLNKYSNKAEAAANLVNWQTAKCATSGFITGLGGLITLPVAVPANISSVLFIQLRMIQAIAIMGGYDPKSDKVKSLCFICLTGNAASGILKSIGFTVSERLSGKAVQLALGKQMIKKIKDLVRYRLFAKTGKLGIINLGKTVPILGGVIGGAIDASTTKLAGKVAIEVFIGKQ